AMLNRITSKNSGKGPAPENALPLPSEYVGDYTEARERSQALRHTGFNAGKKQKNYGFPRKSHRISYHIFPIWFRFRPPYDCGILLLTSFFAVI
ncbi:MAG: hypothetical protein J6U19_01635, partial [Oscillospiraceae bacterium]|nr:hypothetical protein [Oscillospiraceae bacterium]